MQRLHELVKKYSDSIAYPIRFSDTGEAPYTRSRSTP